MLVVRADRFLAGVDSSAQERRIFLVVVGRRCYRHDGLEDNSEDEELGDLDVHHVLGKHLVMWFGVDCLVRCVLVVDGSALLFL